MSDQRDRSEEASATMTTVFTSALGVPIDSEGLEEGCNRMPAALRRSGLIATLGVRDLGDVEAGPVRGPRDPLTGVRGPAEVAAVSLRLRDALLPLLRSGERPLVVGGCCAVLLGAGLAVREVAGRAGLAFVDGHEDFYDGRSSLNGCVADMELAIVTGHGPAGLLPDAPGAPLFRDEDAVALGIRDSTIARDNESPDPRRLAPGLRIIESASLLADGPERTGQRVAAELAAGPGRFWLHFDLDVIDGEAMPAVDDPLPGGPDWRQTTELLRPLLLSPVLLGADVTILNPSLDPGDHYARRVVDLLATAAQATAGK
jgi:arginase